MDIRIIDRSRNVTDGVAGFKGLKSDPIAALDGLLSRHEASLHTGMIEIVCDQEFFDAAKLDTPFYKNVPITVTA